MQQKGAAAATGEKLEQLTQADQRRSREEAAAEVGAPVAVETQPAPSAGGQPKMPARYRLPRTRARFAPMVKAALMSSQSIAGAAAAALGGVSKQWSDLLADVNSEISPAGLHPAASSR